MSVPAGQQLLVALHDSAADQDEVYAKFGAPPTRADYQYRAAASGGNQVLTLPGAAPGVWYILLYGAAVPAASTYTVAATAGSILLTRVTPDHAGSSADASLTLSGAGFDHTTTVSLVAAGGTTYPAASVQLDTPTQLTATFRAGAVPAGVYTVQGIEPGGDAATLPQAFTLSRAGRRS